MLNPGLEGLEFRENTGPNPGSEFGLGVRRKERAESWFGRFRARRKNQTKPCFRVWVGSSEEGRGPTPVWQVRRKEK